MGHSTKDKPVSTYISVKPEYIIAATPPVYRDEKLELYRNSDIAPDGSLYIETPIDSDRILRQPVLLEASPDKFILLLRKTDASGHALSPATRDNTSVYIAYVQDYAEARALMTHFEEHAEKIRQIHQRRAAHESLAGASTNASARAETAPSEGKPNDPIRRAMDTTNYEKLRAINAAAKRRAAAAKTPKPTH